LNIVLSIDDTDIKGTRGTGQLTQILKDELIDQKIASCNNITRHQLFVHSEIPYTSHNSAMCFELEMSKSQLTELIAYCQKFLEKESAIGSDPGLCVAVKEQITDIPALIDYGKRAKIEVLNKHEAYQLAKKLGIHLSEHGGTGQGVIGALAGIGLRLFGNDGRFRGWFNFGDSGDSITVNDLYLFDSIESITSQQGASLSGITEIILAEDKVKTVLKNHKQTLIVSTLTSAAGSPSWITLSKSEAKQY